MKTLKTLIVISTLLIQFSAQAKDTKKLGVIEHDAATGEDKILFFSNYSDSLPLSWTVCDGNADKTLLWERTASKIAVKGIPWAGPKSAEYARWNGEPSYQPLVVGIGISCADPEEWKKYEVTAEEKSRMGVFLMGDIGTLYVDDGKGGPSKVYQYSPKDLKVEQAFQNRLGMKIIRVGLNLPAGQEPVDMAGDSLGRLFVIDMNGKVTNMGEELKFLAAGDFDGDGREEIVFFYSGYNADGYELRDTQMNLIDKIRWTYH